MWLLAHCAPCPLGRLIFIFDDPISSIVTPPQGHNDRKDDRVSHIFDQYDHNVRRRVLEYGVSTF